MEPFSDQNRIHKEQASTHFVEENRLLEISGNTAMLQTDAMG